MNEFIYLSSLDNRNISLQIIKSFSILLLSIKNTQTLYYLFSNNFINQIVSNNFEKYDEEFLSHYVNFLKSLISKLDKLTIQFFFHKNFNSFPLFISVFRMYNFPDGMIKNTVRNILLSLLKLNYEPLIEYFCCLPAVQYFSFICLNIRDLIIRLNEELLSLGSSKNSSSNGLLSIQDDIIIDILYIQDIFSLNNKKISYILINNLFYFVILPLLCGTLCTMTKPKITISTSLYSLILLFYNIKNEEFNNLLFTVLFSTHLNKVIKEYIYNTPKDPINYFSSWDNQKKQTCMNYIQYISFNFSEPFIYSIISQHTNMNGEEIYSDYKEINEGRLKLKKLFKEKIDLSNYIHYQQVLQQILKPFPKEKLNQMMDNHKNLSIASGVFIGLYNVDHTYNAFTFQIQKLYLNLNKSKDKNEITPFEDKEEEAELTINDVRKNLISYLTSKDDILIQLVSLLIYISHEKINSKQLLSLSNLLPANNHFIRDIKLNRKETDTILNEIFSNIDINYQTPDNGNIIDKEDIINLSNISNTNTNTINDQSQYKLNDINDIFESFDSNNSKISHNGNINNEIKVKKISSNDISNLSKVIEESDSSKNKEISFTNSSISNLLQLFKQLTYDDYIIDIHLDLLQYENQFRKITFKILMKNFERLLIRDIENKQNMHILTHHLDNINKLYYSILSSIKLMILNKKLIRESGYEIFETEWSDYSSNDISILIKKIVDSPFCLIPFTMEDLIEDFPEYLKIQKSDIDFFKSLILNFFMINDMRIKIYKNDVCLKERFPLKLTEKDYLINSIYSLIGKSYCIMYIYILYIIRTWR